jgi:O-antigen/teichoic acid export membrane protein
VVYGIPRYFGAFSAIFLTPIYTRILLKEEYGVMDIFSTWNTAIISILPLGMVTAVLRFYTPEYSEKDKKDILGSILICLFGLSGLYILLMLLAKPLVLPGVFATPAYSEVYNLTLVLAMGSILLGFCQNLIRAKLQKWRFLSVALINLFLLNGLGFVFVYFMGMRVEGFYRASVIAMSCSVIAAFYYVRHDFNFRFNKAKIKEVLQYSIHLLSVFVLFQMTMLVDRFLLWHFGSLTEVGLYSVGLKIGSMTQLLISGFSLAWFPIAMSIENKEEAKIKIASVAEVYVVLTVILSVFVMLLREELILFFAPDYMDIYTLIGIVMALNIVSGSVYVFTLGLHITKKTKYLSWAAVISIITNVAASIPLYFIYGMNGIALGSVIGALVWVAIQFYYAQQHFKIDFKWFFSLLCLGVFAIIFFATPILDKWLNFGLIADAAIKLIIGTLFSLIILLPKFRNSAKLLALFKKG